ncbi:hypothetical protein Tco_1224668 [Tanacetum coccineum]
MDSKIKQILGNLVVQEFEGMENLQSDSKGTQENINLYGLSQFVTSVMNEENLNERFLAELFATYDSKKQVARISGRVLNVNKDALAAALNFPHIDVDDVVDEDEYKRFLHLFVCTFMYVNPGVMVGSTLQKIHDALVMCGHPELFDFARFMWALVESEILQGDKIKECYYGRHMQCLIRSQHPDLFANPGVAHMDDDDDDDDDDDEEEEEEEVDDDDDDDDDEDEDEDDDDDDDDDDEEEEEEVIYVDDDDDYDDVYKYDVFDDIFYDDDDDEDDANDADEKKTKQPEESQV